MGAAGCSTHPTTKPPRHARHNLHRYVLDAVCERKKAADLLASVQDRRYGQQKWRLQRCGLRRLYYLLEEPIEQEGFTSEGGRGEREGRGREGGGRGFRDREGG